MSETGYNQLTPKYRGIYDKAMTGRSPKSAIHANCLICTGSKRNDVRNCAEQDCVFWQYRPYQENPWKARKRTRAKISDHYVSGKTIRKSQKTKQPIERLITVDNPPEGRLRLKVIIEPEGLK